MGLKILKYTILGIIQGITEPIPVSSSGHIMLFKNLFNTNMFNDLNFEIVVNFASFLAILFIFRKDIVRLVTSFFKYIFDKDNRKKYKDDFKYCLLIIIGSVPVGIVGVLFKDKVESAMENLKLLGIAFLLTALALFIIRNIKGTKEDKDITYKDAVLIGLMQAIAIVPGISRSGAVLVACLLRGLKREPSLKYTFMLYFPVSLASFALGFVDLIKTPNITSFLVPYGCGFIASLVITYFSYKWLSKVVKNGKVWKFAIYCLIIGLFTLIYFR